MQKSSWSRRKIIPFIRDFDVDPKEFEKRPEEFYSFNDFFIRKLKKSSRPLEADAKIAILPADGRYLAVQDLSQMDRFYVKGQSFDLVEFLKDELLAEEYKDGTFVFARLCPTDYHRFHFPFDCTPSQACLIKGFLYSVNPIALRKRLQILWENKRVLTTLLSEEFGKVLFIEIGATNVGSIKQTFTPLKPCKKGDEKGYFEFGGSSIVMLFKKGSILLDEDLVHYAREAMEVRGLFGESLGKSMKTSNS